MNTTIQPGMHPDAESLNAFAEQLLPAQEREQILAHMATCSRCREVVFLAQHAATEEQPAPAPVVASAGKEARRSWFAGWRLAWIPVAALAGFVGLAVVQHYRHAAPETQMAGNVSQPAAQQKPEAAPAPAAAEKRVQPAKERQTEAGPKVPAREAAKPQDQKDARKNLTELKEIARRDEDLGATGTLAKTDGVVAGGSIHGTLTSRANGVSIGGPMANQLQQNANQIQEQNAAPQQNPLPLTQNNELASANRPTAKAAPGAASETVTVQAESKPVAAPPPTAQQLSLSTVATQSVAVDKLAKKTKQSMLPSGVSALSSASVAKRTIAIDPAGALFLSEDNGKHWQSIPTQWTGRAVLVRVRQAATQPAVLAGVRRAQFELVNDKLQTWVSEDGKTWTAQTIGPK